jgi:hypothetical protein
VPQAIGEILEEQSLDRPEAVNQGGLLDLLLDSALGFLQVEDSSTGALSEEVGADLAIPAVAGNDTVLLALPVVKSTVAEGLPLADVFYQPAVGLAGTRSHLSVHLSSGSGNPVFIEKNGDLRGTTRVGERVSFRETVVRRIFTDQNVRDQYRFVPSNMPFGADVGCCKATVVTQVEVVPFLTGMPVIEGELKTGEVLSAAFAKHPTSVGNEIIEWQILRANGQRILRYGSEYALGEEDFGAKVFLTIRASAEGSAPHYSSDEVTIGTNDENLLQSARDAATVKAQLEQEKRELAEAWSRNATVTIHSTRNTNWQGVGKVSIGFNTVPQAEARKWLTRSNIRHATKEEVLTLDPLFCERPNVRVGFCE